MLGILDARRASGVDLEVYGARDLTNAIRASVPARRAVGLGMARHIRPFNCRSNGAESRCRESMALIQWLLFVMLVGFLSGVTQTR